MYNLNNTTDLHKLDLLLQQEAVDSEELLLERIGYDCDVSRLHSRLCVELVDCDPFNF